MALAIGVVATFQPAAVVLFTTQRLPRPCQLYNLVSVAVTALFSAVMYLIAFKILAHQSWYQPETADEPYVSSIKA